LNLDKYLIKIPIVTQVAASLLKGPGVLWPEVVAPSTDGFIGDRDFTLGQ
jgi:hypothetical protein